MKYRVEIDRSICAGTSNCMEASPDAFEVDDRGLCVLKPGALDEEQYLNGARLCPMDAIRIYDARTGERLYP